MFLHMLREIGIGAKFLMAKRTSERLLLLMDNLHMSFKVRNLSEIVRTLPTRIRSLPIVDSCVFLEGRELYETFLTCFYGTLLDLILPFEWFFSCVNFNMVFI